MNTVWNSKYSQFNDDNDRDALGAGDDIVDGVWPISNYTYLLKEIKKGVDKYVTTEDNVIDPDERTW